MKGALADMHLLWGGSSAHPKRVKISYIIAKRGQL